MAVAQGNLASTYEALGQLDRTLRIRKDVYARKSALFGTLHESTIMSAVNLAATLVDALQQFDEARAFLRDRIPEATRSLGKDHGTTLRLERMHAQCLYRNDGASRDDITTAIATLEELYRRITRIYGATHPQTRGTQDYLEKARETLARLE